jgi:Transposase DDE domain
MNLSLGIYGQIMSQSGLMSEIVRFVPGAIKHKHRLKRFWRFLSNHRLKPERLQEYWVSWCVKTFAKDEIIKVAIDWTTLPGNIQCLMIAIPFAGRAIPLLWQCVKYSDIKDSQNAIEERLVARLTNLIYDAYPKKQILLTADRGFGRATFIEFLLKKNLLFAIRVKADVHIKPASSKTILLRNLGKSLIPNSAIWYESISYRSDGKVTGVNLAAVVADSIDEKEPDPWFLVTNLKTKEESIKYYHQRFHIEEWFKDLKHQLGITNVQTRNLMRIRRLLFLATISYGVLMLAGTIIGEAKDIQDSLITGGKKTASRIWFAVKIIKHKLVDNTFWKKVYLLAAEP